MAQKITISLDEEHTAMLVGIAKRAKKRLNLVAHELLIAVLEDDAATQGASVPADRVIQLSHWRGAR